jgi:DNA polymerase
MLAELQSEAASCVACPLSKARTNVVFGTGDPNADVMFIGEGPGRDEDLAGEPFVGRSGRLLDRLIIEELEMTRAACYIANVVKCRPPGNRDPHPDEVATCRHFLEDQVRLIAPKVIVTLGNFATKAILSREEGITRLRGSSYPYGQTVVVPTFHPAAALRGGGMVLAQMRADFVRVKLVLRESTAGGL